MTSQGRHTHLYTYCLTYPKNSTTCIYLNPDAVVPYYILFWNSEGGHRDWVHGTLQSTWTPQGSPFLWYSETLEHTEQGL